MVRRREAEADGNIGGGPCRRRCMAISRKLPNSHFCCSLPSLEVTKNQRPFSGGDLNAALSLGRAAVWGAKLLQPRRARRAPGVV